jgi:multicomponent Na+:H+ antiporter subunit C
VTWYLIAAIFLIGLWGIIAEPNLIRKVIALSIANSGITVMYVYYAALSGDEAPILPVVGTAVDPIPHALMLTAIVVGICVVALALVLVQQLYRRYGTLDMREIEDQVWHAEDHE